MVEIDFTQLLNLVSTQRSAYHKLVIVVVPSNSGKTRLLKQLASSIDAPVVNLNLKMSQGLLSLTKHQQGLKGEEIARNVVDEQNQFCLCLDNTELLFDSADHGNVEAQGIGRPKEGVLSHKRGERCRIYSDPIL